MSVFSKRDVLITNVTSYFTLQIAVDVSTVNHTGEATPCLELSIKGLGTKVVMHPWDLTASASLGSMAVKEMTFGSDEAPLYLVQTPVGAELLSVKFVKVNQNVLLSYQSEHLRVGVSRVCEDFLCQVCVSAAISLIVKVWLKWVKNEAWSHSGRCLVRN